MGYSGSIIGQTAETVNTPKHVNPPLSGDGRRQWVAQWLEAAPELERVKIAELRAMTEREAARIVNEVLPEPDYGKHGREPGESVGIVEMQRLFMIGRKL